MGTTAKDEDVIDRTMDLVKAVITMVTATQFISVTPHRASMAFERRQVS